MYQIETLLSGPIEITSSLPLLIDDAKISHEMRGQNPGDPEKEAYIKDVVLPNLESTYADYKNKIDSEPDKYEQILLREELLVESIQLFTHPEIKSRLEKISQQINPEGNSVEVGLTLVGSAALGGLLLREATGTTSVINDIDLVGTYMYSDLFTNTETIYPYINRNVMPQIKELINSDEVKTTGTADYKICEAHNPGKMSYPIIETTEEASHLLRMMINGELNSSSLLYNFYPSYPGYHNAGGRYFLLSGLLELSKTDPEAAKTARSELISAFKEEFRPFKMKYFDETVEEWREDVKVDLWGEEPSVMHANLKKANHYFHTLFEELIESTDVTKFRA